MGEVKRRMAALRTQGLPPDRPDGELLQAALQAEPPTGTMAIQMAMRAL